MMGSSAVALTMAVVLAVTVVSGTSADVRRAQTQPPARVTVEQLKSLKATRNDPAGDQFRGSRDELMGLIDAIVQDASLLSPSYLLLASKTAFNLGRLGDAAFLHDGALLRARFDFLRYDASAQATDGAELYLSFLSQTIGGIVNPAIMREPASLSAVISRLEPWEIVPSRDAFYPEFPFGTKFKVPPELWPAMAAGIKREFMKVARPHARLLNDPEYFEAFRFVQAVNLGEVPSSPENTERFLKSRATMEAVQKRLFPYGVDMPAPATSPGEKPPPVAETPSAATLAAVRAGQGVPVPKVLRRVEPEFPPGQKAAIILDVTIGPEGTVTDVRIVRGVPELDAAAVRAVRQWVFEVSRIDGRPVSVVHTVSLSPR